MHFSPVERQRLLALKGVGELVIARLEGLGFASLAQLVDEDPAHITKQISVLMGSTCWHNSPQARKAIASVIALAQQAEAEQSTSRAALSERSLAVDWLRDDEGAAWAHLNVQPEAPTAAISIPPRKNWIAVACATHARRGCAPSDGPGYMQVCHGKAAPLKRVKPGDRVAYYAPTVTMGGKDRLQCFVSLGLVLTEEPYEFDMGGGFIPFRKDVQYVDAQEASILPLVPQFEFVESPQRWGYKFRLGLFDISDHDMRLIATAMQADLVQLQFLQ